MKVKTRIAQWGTWAMLLVLALAAAACAEDPAPPWPVPTMAAYQKEVGKAGDRSGIVSAGESSEPTATRDSADLESLSEVREYAEDNGLDLDEAVYRFEVMDDAGIDRLEAELSAKEADTFGGLWFEHQPVFRIVVTFTRDGERTIEPYLADQPWAQLVEVRVYDPAEGTQTTVWTDPGELAPMVLPFRKIAWSPSGRYLFLSQGCCFVGALYVLDLESKTLVGRYASGTEMWSPEADLVALSVRQPVEHLIPIETGDSSSIALVHPGQITPTIVLTGTEERLYLAKAWLGEDELLYEQLDLCDGGERTERSWGVAEIDSSTDGPPLVVASRPLEVLPVEYDDEAFTEHLSPWLPGVTFAERVWSADGSWVVFRAYGDEEAPDVNRIYAFQWGDGPLVGPLAEGIDPALASVRTAERCPD